MALSPSTLFDMTVSGHPWVMNRPFPAVLAALLLAASAATGWTETPTAFGELTGIARPSDIGIPPVGETKTVPACDGKCERELPASDIVAVLASYPEVARGVPVVGIGPNAGMPGQAVEWVPIPGGVFAMGAEGCTNNNGVKIALPIHDVQINGFEMSKTLVTVEQYQECVIQGQCTEPSTSVPQMAPEARVLCNWGKEGRQRHPVNCVDWKQANQYARFKGARLPSESEWEYAARSGGKKRNYPWGNEEPTCDKAVMYGNGDYGCGSGGTMPVCSKPAGNTDQGLCDMAGNVWQWVQNTYQDSYRGAPTDGGAFEAAGSRRVLRGGSLNGGPVFADGTQVTPVYAPHREVKILDLWSVQHRDNGKVISHLVTPARVVGTLRTHFRAPGDPGERRFDIGFRLARSAAQAALR